MSAFDRLIEQIDVFIRKFYKNQIVKGLLLFAGVLLLTFLLVTVLEYFGRFNSVIRGSLLFCFLGINGYLLVKYIVIPLLRLKSFGKRIDRYQAAGIIGQFFPKVSDRLLNTLQLKDQMNENSADYELLNASVQQRSARMSVVPFADAIDLKENRRYLLWVLPLVFVLLTVGMIAPKIFKQGTERVLYFTEEFKREAPFIFSFLDGQRRVEEGENFSFEVELIGKSLPNKVYVKSDQGRALLRKVAKNKFQGELSQLRSSTTVQFEAMEFKSEVYDVEVIGKTAVGKMQATVTYPRYLSRESEVIENAGDLVLPEGSRVEWSILAKNSARTEFWLNDVKKSFEDKGFQVEQVFRNSTEGKVILENKFNGNRDTSYFNVDVIKDNYPSIQLSEVKDSVKDGIRYFSGMVADDHGLSGLSFVYKIHRKDGSSRVEELKVGKVFGTESPFDFAVDFRKEKLELEDNIEYYFVVRDNDGVNGSKSTKSQSYEYELPSLDELNEKRKEDQESTNESMSELLKEAGEFKENLNELRNEMMNSNRSDWNDQNKVEELKEDHKSLLENLEQLKEEMKNSIEEKDQLSEIDKELLEQQEQIEELLEELMDEELMDLLDQLEELMKDNNKQGIEETMEELEMSAEDMKRQLDRSLEMLKRLQVNEKIDDLELELKELAKEQEALRKETEGEKEISEEQKKEQDEINEKFNELEKDLEELDSLNKSLKSPMELGKQEKNRDDINNDLKDSKENLGKNKGKKASESQKGASEKMEKMAEQLDAAQQQAQQQQQEEDLDLLRSILENLVTLSFNQEDVMERLKGVQEGDPAFRKYSREQRKIVDDTEVVRDSLFALAERQASIAKFIDQELNSIAVNHELTLGYLDEFQNKSSRGKVGVHQQYVMTGYNNLALMLNESQEQMQKKMQGMKQNSGACQNPNGKQGKPKLGSGMKTGDMKEMLKKQLEKMQQKGVNPGEKGEGKSGENGKKEQEGNGGMGNKEVAKMAAQQGAIRRRLEQMRQELNKQGKGLGNKLNPLIRELKNQERDLLNKKLDDNLINRQRKILTRLLESEKALMERGYDEKRESKEGKNEDYGNQIRFDEYTKEKRKQIELLRSVDPAYKKYYKDRANEYFNRMMN